MRYVPVLQTKRYRLKRTSKLSGLNSAEQGGLVSEKEKVTVNKHDNRIIKQFTMRRASK